jgi:hypothetical protein
MAALAFMLMLIGRAIVPVAAAELQERTLRAYRACQQEAYEAFLRRVPDDTAWWSAEVKWAQQLQRGGVVTRPAHEDGIIDVSGGLIHHWQGVTFLPDVTLGTVVHASQAYTEYANIYGPVISSQLLAHDGDTYRILLRVKESVGTVSAVFDIWSVVKYGRGDRRAFAFSESNEIRQVEHAGQRDERHLPAGRDSGYLWRASTFTRYLEQGPGVYVELETLGLSRDFPPLLGWLIEPIARRLGRASVERSLSEFRLAVSKAAKLSTHERNKNFADHRCRGYGESAEQAGWSGAAAHLRRSN